MPNLYPTGTPQQVQLDEGTQQLLAAANSTLSSGQTITPDVAAQAQQGVVSANQNIQNTMTPEARQGYLDNTNLSGMQGNYDALAKQLAQYDNMVLQPQFAGSNPGTPSELGGISGYYNPNLSYNTADPQTSNEVLYNANPKYALSSQVDQGNSIVSLLGTLNKLLSNETKRGTNKYTSDLSKASSILSGLNDILKMNTDLTIKKAELAESRANRASANSEKYLSQFNSEANRVLTKFASGGYSVGNPLEAWGLAFKDLKQRAKQLGIYGTSITDQDINEALGGGWDPMTGESWGNASPQSLLGVRKQSVLDATQRKNLESAESSLGLVTRLKSNFDAAASPEAGFMSVLPGAKEILSYNSPEARSYLADSKGALATLKEMGGENGVLSNQDTSRLSTLMPGLGEKKETGTAYLTELENRIKRGIIKKYGMDMTMEYNGKTFTIKNGDLLKPEVEEAIMKGAQILY